VYGRTLDGQELTLAASGWTWQNTFVLWDHETGSTWFGGAGAVGWDDLVCIGGPLQGARLPSLDLHRTFWRSWHDSHPGSKIMRRRQP
jgi:hypothetical protein